MNKKEDYISYLDGINKEIANLTKEKSSVLLKIKDLTDKEFESSLKISFLKNEWKEILKAHNNEINEIQKKMIENYLKPVNKLVSIAGVFPESNQISIKLSLINYKYNQNQIQKLLEILKNIISGIIPISIDKSSRKFKVIPIFEVNKGEKGSYSLIIDSFGRAAIFKESKNKKEVITNFSQLNEILIYIAKNLYYYTI